MHNVMCTITNTCFLYKGNIKLADATTSILVRKFINNQLGLIITSSINKLDESIIIRIFVRNNSTIPSMNTQLRFNLTPKPCVIYTSSCSNKQNTINIGNLQPGQCFTSKFKLLADSKYTLLTIYLTSNTSITTYKEAIIKK